MINIVGGLLLGFFIGAGCRWFDLPLPAPPRIVGALLVVAMTLGFLLSDWFLVRNTSLVDPQINSQQTSMDSFNEHPIYSPKLRSSSH